MNDLDLDKCRRHLHSNTPLIAGWLQERTIESLVEDASAEAIRLLEEAVIDFADDDRGDAAFSAITRLAEAGNTPAPGSTVPARRSSGTCTSPSGSCRSGLSAP